MKSNTKLALSLIAAGGLIAIPVYAYSGNDMQGHGGQQSTKMMEGGHNGGMMGGQRTMQKMMRMHGSMMGDGMGNHGAMSSMMGNLDDNGDGTVTADEARNGLTVILKKYDSDGNGTLSLDEFEVLHSTYIREQMVDRFQALDNDGDGQVTGSEITAPADRIERMQTMHTKRHGTGNGSMMNNN